MARTRSMGGGGPPAAPAASASPAVGKNITSHQPDSPLTIRRLRESLNLGSQVSNTSSPTRGSLRSGRNRLPLASLSSPLPDNRIIQDANHEADDLSPTSPDKTETEESEKSEEFKTTPRARTKEPSPRATTENMSAATPSEATMGITTGTTGTTTDDGGTPVNDTPIPLDLYSARRAKTPDVDITGSSSASSAPPTPTKPASERRKATPKGPKLISHKEANRQLRDVIVAHNEKGDELKETSTLYKDLTREENTTPIILDECVAVANARLVRAIDDVEALEAGHPPRVIPYPADKIPELLAAVEKAEAERDAFDAENQRLFAQMATLNEGLYALKAKVKIARKLELEARIREGMPTPSAACNKPIAPSRSGLPVILGTPIDSPPTAVGRLGLTDKTTGLDKSPASSKTIVQKSTARNSRAGMRTSSLNNPQTPTRKRKARR
ncbi:hypothetical protein HER10_EVM0004297 [Colletotrichum scovillei]|uniref:Uncharacterized protein n=1 Tax=Colletotrichum scovillei TaxID=1209932 RepID=A0A9P7U9Q9_9PEZI|nr:uncharacterized protein HER10_EVM0004297 [Colletotrichum scovillei]KAF4780902.1 hypothetical protein HER10_EVM0004297 [Colletotrichum scovillei]KAG7045703.1 hypothetical protein JMJ77_0009781 [Colletotrichum scovillei]KAG7052866.1 hypothetical protein JMJ78_0005877 [Colletotrichum scovillei]KAG7065156.1 hypothetical protein JMJ76_0012908 [Colletotrichum scovillei]